RALEVASGRGEAKARHAAEAVLESVRSRVVAAPSAAPSRAAAAQDADALAADLVRSLSQTAAG
ncbi:MAG TPA: hypothetical protein VGR37_04185, partial [Longimicrobiaceae bacterium]|nr:hypothetical protein [Longimicrobiaceae bacterium]